MQISFLMAALILLLTFGLMKQLHFDFASWHWGADHMSAATLYYHAIFLFSNIYLNDTPEWLRSILNFYSIKQELGNLPQQAHNKRQSLNISI